MRNGLLLFSGILLGFSLSFAAPARSQDTETELPPEEVSERPPGEGEQSSSISMPEKLRMLEDRLAALESILQYVHVEEEPINGLAGPHVIFEGVNVCIQDGTGTKLPYPA